MGDKDRGAIRLTHVCRAWRGIFVSQPSLWTKFDCRSVDKTHTYLERSKSSPINLSLNRDRDLSPNDPFLQIIPHVIGRLKYLSVKGKPENLQDVTAHLSRPAPLLEYLSVHGGCEYAPQRSPMLTSPLFDEDLSSLRELRLTSVRTELPWRNMVNLTSFTLAYMPPDEDSIRHLLDFFESAPRLSEVHLDATTPTSGAQNGRMVSLTCLKRMSILGSEPSSLLLDHLLIPIGAELTTRVDFLGPLIEDHFPRSLDNLRNLPDFTEIHLYAGDWHPRVQFSGPNGRVAMVPVVAQLSETTQVVLESLDRFDTSRVERLEMDHGDPFSGDLFYQTLSPMRGLRTLTLSRCRNLHTFIDALHPSTSLEDVVCPELEELVLVLRLDREALDIDGIVEMAAARASRGAKLKSVRIVSHDEAMRTDALELKKHVSRVKYGPNAGGADDDSEDDEEEET